MKVISTASIIIVLIMAFFVPAQAVDVALFNNGTYVDYSIGDSGSEASNLEATLNSQGHTITLFNGITDADFTNAVTGNTVLVIPELENGDLNPDLTAAARTAIANFVNNGGIFIGFGSSLIEFMNLANGVFGFSLSMGFDNPPYAYNAAGASGTPFQGGPASLIYNDDTNDIDQGSLPPGTRVIYNNGTDVGVFMAPFGSGHVVFLGWDWYDAQPVGAEDNGWLSVLDAAVNLGALPAASVPTMNNWGMMIFFVLAGIGSIYYIRKRKITN